MHSSPSLDPPTGTAVAKLASYFELLKPRVMSLVVFTGLTGMLVAPGRIGFGKACGAILCIAAGAGAAGAINMWYERNIDRMMRRTCRRPLPTGRVAPQGAMWLGCGLAILSVFAEGVIANWLAASLLAAAIFFYVVVYTIWLKPRTVQNIVIGGAAGAFPPLIGWSSVTGSLEWQALALFGLIFFWTPPHFWALALYRSEDYARAGIPMLPVVVGRQKTKQQILIYTLILWPVAIAPTLLGLAGISYGIVALGLSIAFTALALRLRGGGDRAAKRMFEFSILYLFTLFALLIIDRPG